MNPKAFALLFILSRNSFLDGLMDIYTSYEYVSNHTTLREHAELVSMQSRIMKQMVDECREMMASLLKGENVPASLGADGVGGVHPVRVERG